MAQSDVPPTLASLRRGRPMRNRVPLPAREPGLFDQFSSDPLPTEDSSSESIELRNIDTIPDAAAQLEPPGFPALPAAPPAAPRIAQELPIPAAAPPYGTPLDDSAADAEAKSRAEAQPQTWTVTGLLRHVRSLVERGYGRVTVEGEISNWRPSGSGHCYFTVKDAGAQLSAVLFRRQASLLRFQPRDGDAVKLHGQLSVYENRGQMQLIVEWMQQAGLGALLAEMQRLKEQLRREGLFDRKRPLPPYPKCIGVITSLQGAALRDIVKVCRRRHAAVQLVIYPVAVQGPNCAAEVVAALRWFSAHRDQAEVVLLARGGGSWEDLHGFDHEQVARAIADCALPVITGIGHATDSTIADAAADLCAPTPSAAAEVLTAAQHRVEEHVASLHNRLVRGGSFELLRARGNLERLGANAVLRRVESVMNRRAQRLDESLFRAHNAAHRYLRSRINRLRVVEARLPRLDPTLRLQGHRRRLDTLSGRLERAASERIATAYRRQDGAAARLYSLSPLRVLDRGYALVYGEGGQLLRSAAQASAGQQIFARLAEGNLTATVSDASGPSH